MNNTFRLQSVLFLILCGFLQFAQAKNPLKILAIGNSFTVDAVQEDLYYLAKADGLELIIGYPYKGGTTLEMHCNNIAGDTAIYDYRKVVDGKVIHHKKSTMKRAVTDEDWDYVIIQTDHNYGGLYEHYFPYLTNLIDYVKANVSQPDRIRLGLYMTWAYDKDSNYKDFVLYGSDQERMYRQIVECAYRAAKETGIDLLIPGGTAVQNGRTSCLGDRYNRDGYHMDLDHGRYTMGCVWYEKITGRFVTGNAYHPKELTPYRAAICQHAAHLAIRKPREVTSMEFWSEEPVKECFGDNASGKYPEWLESAAIYHIYPSSYMDSNGDGYGDLEGIRSRLDYVKTLGFNTIWISPVFCSKFEDGGYDITDFYKIDPRFGTNTDLVNLVNDAHAKGIKVCLDLVGGHTSDKHPWFQESANGDRNGHYADYYIWTKGNEVIPPKPERGGWVKNEYPRDGYYLMNYYDIQPALNYGYYQLNPENPWEQGYDAPGPKAVRQEIKNIISFWFDKGVDGFRCDLAWSLVKGDDADFHGVRKLWDEIFTWQAENYPETIFLSEWSSPVEAISCGFDIDIIRHNGCGKTMYRDLVHNTDRNANPETGVYKPKDCWFDRAGKGQFASFAVPFMEMYEVTKGQGFPCMPTSSHDTWRLNRNQRSTPEELKTAMTFFLTMPWVPIVYYGEEIGMRSMDGWPFIEGSRDRSAQRTPMQWGEGETAGFSTCGPSGLYLPIDPDPKRPTVAAQINDSNSILNWVKGLLALRSSIPALGNTGGWKLVSNPQQAYPAVYERFGDNSKYLVVINPRGKSATALVEGYDGLEVIWGNPKSLAVKKSKNKLVLKIEGVSSVVCKVTK